MAKIRKLRSLDYDANSKTLKFFGLDQIGREIEFDLDVPIIAQFIGMLFGIIPTAAAPSGSKSPGWFDVVGFDFGVAVDGSAVTIALVLPKNLRIGGSVPIRPAFSEEEISRAMTLFAELSSLLERRNDRAS